MLYHLYEMNHIALTPLRKIAKCQKELLETSYNPFANSLLHKVKDLIGSRQDNR